VVTPLAVAIALQKSGAVVIALLAATVLLARTPRIRALAMLGALVLTPVLLISQVYDTDQSPSPATIRRSRWPVARWASSGCAWPRRSCGVAPRAAVAARIRAAVPHPDRGRGSTANLLVPLYLVVGAGTLAHLWPTLVALRRGDPEVGDEEPRRPRPDARPARSRCTSSCTGLQTLYSKDVTKAEDNLVFFYVPFRAACSSCCGRRSGRGGR